MISYLEVYARETAPRLRAIDLKLKSGENLTTAEASALLGITDAEVKRLHGGETLTPTEFLSLMRRGSGAVCGLYRRELERGSPVEYTPDDISYIYGIDYASVRTAFGRLCAVSVTAYMLPDVLAGVWL